MLTAVLIINGLIILANLIFVTPSIKISANPFPEGRQADVQKIILK